jgi:hypothetical protein
MVKTGLGLETGAELIVDPGGEADLCVAEE